MDDENAQSAPVAEPVVSEVPAPEPAQVEMVTDNTPVSEPISEPTESVPVAPVEDQMTVPATDEPTTEPASEPISEPLQPAPPPVSAPAAPTPQVPQAQSPAQPDQTGFIRALLAKANAKIQSNKQKKLDKIILLAQKKKIIANEDVQKTLHISSATATRYLVKLVQQGHLARAGNPRDAKYQFLH
ncbi:MAG: hypothetical protein ABSF56_03370 [Minisyncoccia bacterium]|jgi:outer membrane biosynthesis protein TonB